jgi:urease accessory protein UreF
MQIENTRLMEELQGKDYQMGRKMLKAETTMIEKEVANSKYAERIKELEDSLTQAIDAKRDLEIEFIALKKNYITQQKDIQQLKNNTYGESDR